MTRNYSSRLLFLFVCCILLKPIASSGGSDSATPSKPPAAKTEYIVDDYFGTKVSDPYRWMEAGAENPAFLEFLKSQNSYTRSVLESLSTPRKKLLARIDELDNAVPVVRSWQRADNSIFYLETAPGALTASLLVRVSSGKPRKLFDPTQFDAKHSHAAVDYFAPSYDGKYVLAGVSLGGSEDSTIRVVEAGTGRMLPDAISRTQYAGPSWRTDSQSFYYARLQKLEPGAPPSAIYENERTYLHVLGTDPEKDDAVFGAGVGKTVTLPTAGFTGVTASPGSGSALAFYSAGTTDPLALYAAPADKVESSTTPWVQIVSSSDRISPAADSPIAVHGATLYLLVEKDAPNRRLISIDLDHPDISHAKVLIPPGRRVLMGVYAAKDGLHVSSKEGVKFDLRRIAYEDASRIEDVPIPYSGTISNVDGNVLLPGVVFRLESWTQSDQVFSYDPATRRVSNIGLVKKHPADFSQIEAREVEAPSADGTMVPLSILCQRNAVLDGSHPALYEGYGAYGISIDPYFDARVLAWVERGGVFAMAHVRGGGEYGEAWHNAGRKETKQHTIDDMVAAAQYLIQRRYTSPEHLAVRGTSAGGISVGGALVQHPELFAVAIDNVGMTDLLRFQTSQGGAANVPEFGDVADLAGFKSLYAVSPYHQVAAGTKYPAVMGITGVHDPRVPSWMVAEMIARLQAATASGHPVVLRVDFDAGHGFGSNRQQREEQMADEMSFILWQTGDAEFQPLNTSAKR
jgi:prolyl oligopeptidase